MVIEAQAWRQHGAVGQLHIVFGEQRKNFRLRIGAASAAGNTWHRAVRGGLRGRRRIFHPLLIPLDAEGGGLIYQHLERHADFAVQQHIVQLDGIEAAVGEDAFGAARQPFVDARVAGIFIARVAVGADAVIPGAGPLHREVLPIEAVSLFAIQTFHQRAGVGVLGVARIEVALAAVARLKLQRLHRRERPAQQRVDIFIDHPFAPARIASGVGAGAIRRMLFVDVVRVRLGFRQIAVESEADVVAQRPFQAEVGAARRALVLMLRHVVIGVPGSVPLLVVILFGNDIHHAARRAVAVAHRCRPADHLDTFDHLRRHPVGVAARIAFAAPAETHRVAAGDRHAVHQDQGIFRPHAANIDLAIVAALAAGGVAGQIDARHGADDLRYVARRRTLFNLVGGDGGDARRLQVLLRRADHQRIADVGS